MSDKVLKLKGNATRRSGPYPLGEIPDNVVLSVGRQIVHRLAVGNPDITGDDFGGIFANAIDGIHRQKPLGIADIEWETCAWSCKTVSDPNPFSKKKVRAISGRNSPNYSLGITNYFDDIPGTGRAVLEIWNARVDEALNAHDDLRVLVFIRNLNTLNFTIFEQEASRYIPLEYVWSVNDQGNFVARDAAGLHRFTWQPNGGQFTVIHHVPLSAVRFKINKHPSILEFEEVLRVVGFEDDWIEKVEI